MDALLFKEYMLLEFLFSLMCQYPLGSVCIIWKYYSMPKMPNYFRQKTEVIGNQV